MWETKQKKVDAENNVWYSEHYAGTFSNRVSEHFWNDGGIFSNLVKQVS